MPTEEGINDVNSILSDVINCSSNKLFKVESNGSKSVYGE